jgi:hypothetical protein
MNDVARYGADKAKNLAKMATAELKELYAKMKAEDCRYDDNGNWLCVNRYRTEYFERIEMELRQRS